MAKEGDKRIGNQFWKLADPSKIGRPVLFKTPHDLWEAAKPYFEWVENNPIQKTETITSEKGVTEKVTEHKIPYTWEGLYASMGVGNLEQYKQKKEFSEIIELITNIIRGNKIQGAAAGIFNSNIVARYLGLKDKSDVTTDDKPIQSVSIDKWLNTNADTDKS